MKTITSWALSVAVSVGVAGPARGDNDMEIGGFAGSHLFNDDNELGVVDQDSAASLKNAVTFGVRVAFNFSSLLAVEGELGVVPTRVRDGSTDVTNTNWRLAGLVHLAGGALRPFVLAGVGGSTAQSSDTRVLDNDTDLVGQLGVGATLRGGANWGVRFDARAILPPSSASEGPTTDWEATLGVYKTFGARPIVKAPPVSDGDGDGQVDATDRCPEAAEDPDGFDDGDGCPDLDNDGDRIADVDDRCPTEPESVNQFEDDDGCPDQEPDLDGDGVTGAADRCAAQPEDRDGFDDADGCPDPDNDADGVADTSDTCGTELESPNGFEDLDGCADVVPDEIARVLGPIKGVTFKGRSDKLAPGAARMLDGVVTILGKYPDLHLEISGHTDDQGDRDTEVDLSRRQAEAVKALLVARGIAPDRIATVGHGPDRPVEGTAPAQRVRNRRIEARLVAAGTGTGDAAATQPMP